MAFLMGDLADGHINKELDQLVCTIDKNQLGCQNDRCVCERLKELQRGEKIVRSMTKQRAIRKAYMDNAEIRRGVDEGSRSRALPARIENGCYGGGLSKGPNDRRGREDMKNAIARRETDEGEIGIPKRREWMIWGEEVAEIRSTHLILIAKRANPNPITGPVASQSIPQHRQQEWIR